MLITTDIAGYRDTLRSKLRTGLNIHRYYGSCMHTLISRWASRVTPHQLAILMFVLDRTFYHDKLSETVVFDQFLNGMQRTDSDEMIFCGLNMSKNTLVLQLKELVDGEYMHALACHGADGKTEIKARLFAINCKKLFNLDIADEENPMILREPKQKRVVQRDDFADNEVTDEPVSRLKLPKQVRRDPPNLTPPNLGAIYISNTVTKVTTTVGTAPQAEHRSAVEVLDMVLANRRERLALAQTKRTSSPTKNSAARNNPYSKVNVQGMLDSAMASTHPNLPRLVVSEKPLGVLKKRVAEAKIDMEAFLAWAVTFWTVTVSAHERAARRRSGEEGKHVHKPIPAAPDFHTLCYRFPYFAQCFRSHVHTENSGLATTREKQLEETVEKLKRVVTAAKQDVRGAQERERNLRRRVQSTPEPVQPVARIRRAAPVAAIDLDDHEVPKWDDHPAPTRRRK